MENILTGDQYSKLPVYMHCMYEYKDIDCYVLADITNKNFISNMYYQSKDKSFAEFKIWFFKNSPIRVIDNLEIL